MDSPEIDEAAASARAQFLASQEGEMDRNLARAALRWKARAEAAEAERDSTVREWNDLYLKLQNADKSRPPKVCAMGMLDALIADRDDAKERLRVMESRMKQIHAALLASMSDEELAQSVEVR